MAIMRGDNNHHHHVPRGCVAVLVGQKEERFVIPVTYLNHPKFMVLLKEAEEVYGFRHKGNIILPCHVDDFLNVQGLTEQEIKSTRCSPHHHHHHHNNHHHCRLFLRGVVLKSLRIDLFLIDVNINFFPFFCKLFLGGNRLIFFNLMMTKNVIFGT
ncbi:hypothetical protein MKX01_017880 [Papaver californicum]|nr:hypothetical protein MKX01_017880 [Papaver californicum]